MTTPQRAGRDDDCLEARRLRRLMAEYGASLGTDAVIRCIADAVGHFDEAPVRTYVMLLVERRATAQLPNQARRAAADPADSQGRPS
jgi:hypothetical protein